MYRSKGSILLETVLAVIILSIVSMMIMNLVMLKRSSSLLSDDLDELKWDWQEKNRCDIYCPGEDPAVDIVF